MLPSIALLCKRSFDGQAPHRTLPILGLDLNDGLGMEKGRRIKSDALSASCRWDEGYASKLFREMVEEQKMYAASGHFRPLVTYHGTQGGQTFDRLHLALPVLRWLSHQGRGTLPQRTNPTACYSPVPLGSRPRLGQICLQTTATRTDPTEHLLGVAMKMGFRKKIHGKSRSRRKRGRNQAPTHTPQWLTASGKTSCRFSRRGRVLRPRTQKRTDRWAHGAHHRQGNDTQTKSKRQVEAGATRQKKGRV